MKNINRNSMKFGFSLSMLYLYILFVLFTILYIYYNYYYKTNECNFIGATGSSDNHALFLSNVIYSFSINNPDCILYCYNLDLNNLMYKKIKIDILLTNKYIKRRRAKGKIIFLNYTQNIYNKSFAVFSMSFKPTIIYRLLKKHLKTVIWMDAGTEILKPLENEVRVAKKYGFYMDRNRHILLEWAHPSAIKYFNFTRNMFIGLHDTEAGYLTIDYNTDFIKRIVEPWYECSKHIECICPHNFTRKYYRRDQPALSMLIYSALPYSKYVGIEEIKDSHIRQCDHKNGCNLLSNYVKVINGI